MSDENTTALVHQPSNLPSQQFAAFSSMNAFVDAQRMAKALCHSSIVPDAYRGEERIGDCVIALEIANRIGATVLAVMQNLYIVYGKPGWSSQFLISCLNATRNFTPLRYRMTGEKGKDTWGCIAWANEKADPNGEPLESPEVTIHMAKVEGWYDKKGSKWQTMPDLMLRYRAATFFVRLYAPELTMGIQTQEEIIDVEATPVPEAPKRPALPGPSPAVTATQVAKPAAPQKQSPPPTQAATQTAPSGRTETRTPGRTGRPSRSAPASDQGRQPAPAQPEKPAQEPDALQAAIEDASKEEGGTDQNESPELSQVASDMRQFAISEDQVLKFCADKKLFRADGQPAEWLHELTPERLKSLHAALVLPNSPILAQIKAIA